LNPPNKLIRLNIAKICYKNFFISLNLSFNKFKNALLDFDACIYIIRVFMKRLTIAIIDTAYHVLSHRAMNKALEITRAESLLVLSDRDFFPGSKYVKIDPIKNKFDYSDLALKELGKHINTDFVLVIQYDGMPIDPLMWLPEFLNYDYIGAPWRWYPEGYSVGNGGFSLRSRKLTDLCLDQSMLLTSGIEECQEDVHIGILYKNWLVSKGVQYAPVPLASKFSAEEPGGRFKTFGFHGALCLPFYLDDEHLSFYISQLTEKMLENSQHIRLIFSLISAGRYNHIREFMVRALILRPDFKKVMIEQFPKDKHYYPNLTIMDILKIID